VKAKKVAIKNNLFETVALLRDDEKTIEKDGY
jgi:hypothetical protein